MSFIDSDPKNIAQKIAPYGDIERGVRKSKPEDENGLVKYVWRLVRFHTGADTHMPVTAFWWLQDWIDEKGIDASVSGIHDEKGKEILDEADELVDEVIGVFGLDPTSAARTWKRVGLF